MPAKEPTASSCVQQRLLDKVRYVRIGDRARQKRETVHSSSCWCVSALLYHARRGPMPGQAHKKGLRSSIAKQPQICPAESKMKSWLHKESEDGTRQAFSHASAIKTKKSAAYRSKTTQKKGLPSCCRCRHDSVTSLFRRALPCRRTPTPKESPARQHNKPWPEPSLLPTRRNLLPKERCSEVKSAQALRWQVFLRKQETSTELPSHMCGDVPIKSVRAGAPADSEGRLLRSARRSARKRLTPRREPRQMTVR